MMGFNQEQVLVMVNGIPMNNAQTGHHNFSFPFDVEQIERIEILRGGETFLWYFSGAGGAINIITSDQKSFKISRSSFNTTLSNLDFSSKHFHFSSGIVSTDGYMHGLDGKKYFLRSGSRIFFNETKNLIDWRREAWQNIWVSENLKKGRYYGLDLSLSHSWEKTLFRILYTLQKAEFEEKASIKSLKYHYYFPEQSLSLAANLSLKFISAGLVCKWEREKHTKKNRVYLNIKVEKKLDKISLFFEALNLFNIRVEKTPGLPEAPRSYCLGLNFNF